MNEVDSISFVNKFVEEILNNAKTETIRFNLNRKPTINSVVDAINQNGDVFAEIRIIDVYDVKVKELPNINFEGHRNYKSTDDAIEHLNEYYHDTITPESYVTIIKFELVQKQ